MITSPKNRRTCKSGHTYYKSSDCPACPICEQERKPNSGFLSQLVAPARRALEHEGITTLQQLSRRTEKDIAELHGIGPTTIPKLKAALAEKKLTFRKK